MKTTNTFTVLPLVTMRVSGVNHVSFTNFQFTLKVFTSGADCSSGTSSNMGSRCGEDGGAGVRSSESESSVVTGGAAGDSGGVSCLSVGGVAASGRSDSLLICVSRLLSPFLLKGVGGSSGDRLSATGGGGGGGSVGATNCLIGRGESGGVVGFPGCFEASEWWPTVHSGEEILGFGGRGGLDLGRWFSSGLSLDKEETEVRWDESSLGEEGGDN